MKVLVTGAAGFIGSKVMLLLSSAGHEVVGIDNINDYNDVRIKYGRLSCCGISMPAPDAGNGHSGIEEQSASCGTGNAPSDWPWKVECRSTVFPHCRFIRMGIDDKEALDSLFEKEGFEAVVNLAAQAGVRYSITHPYEYLNSNMTGFLNILEACRNGSIRHLVFASSSSVYGMNTKVPYSEEDKVDTPVSLYAASKKADELMAHCYSRLYGIPVTGLRYFTVYGPWGRPDMSPMLFARAIGRGEPIKVFNYGDMMRDFTYIDDIAEGTVRVLDRAPAAEACPNGVPYRIFNIGCSRPVKLLDFIAELEDALGKKAVRIMAPMQPGDVWRTYADTTSLEKEIGFKPSCTLKEGIRRFAAWYLSDENPLREA